MARQRLGRSGGRARQLAVATAALLIFTGTVMLCLAVDRQTAEVILAISLVALGASGLLAVFYSGPIRSGLLREAHLLAEPTLLQGLPRRRTLVSVLSATYGMTPELVRPVAHALLGGAHDDPQDGEPTISTRTVIHYELADAPGNTYTLIATVTERYSRPIRDDRVVVFTTSDARLEKRISEAAIPQIFDIWVTYDRDLYLSQTEKAFETLGIGIHYLDIHGQEHSRDVVQAVGRTVDFAEWDQYLSFFTDTSSPSLRTDDYRDSLRIYEYNLSDLEVSGHELAAVTQVTTRTPTQQSIDDQHCFWSASHPSYIDTVTFDVSRFGLTASGRPFEFRVLSFLIKGEPMPKDWMSVDDRLEIPVRSLFLPGNGVALLWRPTTPQLGRIRR